MKNTIPKIIHQIWSGIDEPLLEHFRILGETWKEQYPEWKYEFWDNDRMNVFVEENYPEYWHAYNRFPYNVQRWDAIRYLILDKTGGMYVDFDYESLEPLDILLKNKTCCFAREPQSHCRIFGREEMFNNALMACIPGHPFMRKIITAVFSEKNFEQHDLPKHVYVLKTTGPLRLTEIYKQSSAKERELVYLIPAKYVTPFDVGQTRRVRMGEQSEELDKCLAEAYAVHYFFGTWMTVNKYDEKKLI
jgi:mannosyltransferase OCH1-like enzyme